MNSNWIPLLSPACFAMISIIGIAKYARSRAFKRWLTALDIHAEREIKAERCRKALKNVQRVSSATF
jgi:hypothetical protein